MTETTAPTQEERNAAAVAIALSQGWEDDADGVTVETYDDCSYEAGAATFLVLTDAEADDRARTYCEQSAWAFNSSFLADYVPEGITAEMIDTMRGDNCESFNDAALALIKAGRGFEEFWTDAVAADGRGHFLSGYDGEEIEADEGDWYAYRTN